MEDAIQEAFEVLEASDRILVGAGAGMGVDSGLPDFRGHEGFWNAYPPFRRLGLSFVDMANPRWFRDDPRQAWGFYGHRHQLYQATPPHAGFGLLLDWLQQRGKSYFVFTSNVDGHFQHAGYDTERLVECHGSLNHLQCMGPCDDCIWENRQSVAVDESTFRATGPLPECPSCGALARPNVLMFGDRSWSERRTGEQVQRYRNWLESSGRAPLVAIELGAGTAVPTVRMESECRAERIIRVNPREADGPRPTISIRLGALQAIQRLVASR